MKQFILFAALLACGPEAPEDCPPGTPGCPCTDFEWHDGCWYHLVCDDDFLCERATPEACPGELPEHD